MKEPPDPLASFRADPVAQGEGPAATAHGGELVETFSRLVHEVKTPLAALRALAQGLDYEPSLMVDPAAREVAAAYSRRMVSEVDRLVRLLDSFKGLSKPRHCPARRAHLKEIVSGAVHDTLANRASQRGVRFRIKQLDDAVVPIDRDEALQILTNLVENAIRATPTGGLIAISVERGAAAARLVVDDTGDGLSDEALASLREGRGPRSTKGSGIGLLVVRAIVAAAGGGLAFERRAPTGTRVVVELPLGA
jgi:signal transduction histidine kinase